MKPRPPCQLVQTPAPGDPLTGQERRHALRELRGGGHRPTLGTRDHSHQETIVSLVVDRRSVGAQPLGELATSTDPSQGAAHARHIYDPLQLLTVDDVVTLFRVTKSWVYDMAERGGLPHLKLSHKALRFRRGDLEAWLDEQVKS